MKTISITYLFILTVMISASAQKTQEPDLKEKGLTGNVKSVHETFYKAIHKSGKVIPGKKINSAYDYESRIIFNDKGYKIEDTRYTIQGNAASFLKYVYNEKQNCIEEDRYNADNSIAHKGKFAYTYDGAGKVTQEDWVSETGNNRKVNYKYDTSGNVIEKNWFNANGTLDFKMTFAYDNNGNIMETAYYKSNGKRDLRITYKMNANKKVIEETWFKNGTKFLIKYLYTYDDMGNKTKTDWCRENGKVYASWTYQYEYDKNNNWIKAIELNPDKTGPVSARDEYLVERQIEYFN